MIYITGDIHGNPIGLSKDSFPEGEDLTKDDTVIICGDFGLLWDYKGENSQEKYWLDWLESKPWTTVFVPGNHENYNRLYSLEVKEWNQGKVGVARPSVLLLKRGEIYNIEGKKFFAFGGARSHDIRDGILDPVLDKEKIKIWKKDPFKLFRILNISWWEREFPTEEEMQYGLDSLKQHDNKVDFIITHCCSSSTLALLSGGAFKPDMLTDYFEKIRQQTEYKKWIFGHYHNNKNVTGTDLLIYEQIIRIV